MLLHHLLHLEQRNGKKLRIPKRLQQDSDYDENDVRQETDKNDVRQETVENDVRQETVENDVRQKMRRLRNTEACRIARLDPLRRQQEQEINTKARRRVHQQDSERRQEE